MPPLPPPKPALDPHARAFEDYHQHDFRLSHDVRDRIQRCECGERYDPDAAPMFEALERYGETWARAVNQIIEQQLERFYDSPGLHAYLSHNERRKAR